MFFKKGESDTKSDAKIETVIKDDISSSVVESAEDSFYQEAKNAPEFTDKEKKRLLLKIDLRILPYVSLLYLLSFLDRVNIGKSETNR